MIRFQSILIAIDVEHLVAHGDEGWPAEVASLLEGAQRLHDLAEGKLTVMTVIPEGSELDDQVEQAGRERLERQVTARLGRPATVIVARGTPFLEIVREVMRSGHDLVGVAARREGSGGIVGDLARQLIRKCPCPVWVASRLGREIGPRTVLSAVTMHELTPRVLDLSAAIVAARGGDWHVLHVPEYPLEGGMRLRGASVEEIGAYEKACREEAWAKLHEFVEPYIEAAGVEPKLWMSEGRPSKEIAEAEAKLGVDVVVMGTIGRGGLAGMLIGSTAERTIELVRSSVVAVKPSDFVSPVTPD